MPKNTSPKVKALMAKFTKDNADKAHAKLIRSIKYIMKYWPAPCVSLRSYPMAKIELPREVALTGGRTLTAKDAYDFTMRIITMGNNYRSDLQYSVQTFLKAIKPWMPSGLCINSDWANCKNRKTDKSVLEAIDEFEGWVEDYFNTIESQLAGLYLHVGDRQGSAFMKVLEKRFRDHWNTTQPSVRFNAKAEVPSSSEDTEDQKTTTVTFNFETVLADENDKP